MFFDLPPGDREIAEGVECLTQLFSDIRSIVSEIVHDSPGGSRSAMHPLLLKEKQRYSCTCAFGLRTEAHDGLLKDANFDQVFEELVYNKKQKTKNEEQHKK